MNVMRHFNLTVRIMCVWIQLYHQSLSKNHTISMLLGKIQGNYTGGAHILWFIVTLCQCAVNVLKALLNYLLCIAHFLFLLPSATPRPIYNVHSLDRKWCWKHLIWILFHLALLFVERVIYLAKIVHPHGLGKILCIFAKCQTNIVRRLSSMLRSVSLLRSSLFNIRFN